MTKMDDNAMEDSRGSGDEARELSYETQRAAERRGFFTIYKPGQGKWTRLGTVGAIALLGLLTAQFLWQHLAAWGVSTNWRVGVIGTFIAVFVALAFWLLNKPTNADFLIATDSEMKKVNWTSRKELIGSTKVVILFMFAIAIFLFVVDVLFGFFFQAIRVLKYGPFQQ